MNGGRGMSNHRETSRDSGREWRQPRLIKLGNVHEWVLEGGAKGKYGIVLDGSTSGNNEAMD